MLTLTSFEHQERTISLVVPETYFAEELFQLLQNNYHQFSQWLPWVDQIQSPIDEARFLQISKEELLSGTTNSYVILVNAQPAGMIDLHNFNHSNHSVEIGYWLAKEYQGSGIMTETVRALIGASQNELSIHKVIIVMDVDNVESRAIPQRLSFIHEARLKDHLFRNGQYHDADVYYKIVDK